MLDKYSCDLPGLGITLTPGLPAPLCPVALGVAESLTHPPPSHPPPGLLLRLPFLDAPPDSQCYEDQMYWEVRPRCSPSGPQGPSSSLPHLL